MASSDFSVFETVFFWVLVLVFQTTILRKGRKIMANLDALNKAIADLSQAVSDVADDMTRVLTDLTNAMGSNDQAGVDAAVSGLQDQITKLQSLKTQADQSDPPPPAA